MHKQQSKEQCRLVVTRISTLLAVGLYPTIVSYQLALWEAAFSLCTKASLLVGTLSLLPVILTYSSWSCWVFRR